LNITDLNLEEKILSFAFRPEHYYTSIIASYYFRVLYTKKDEIKYLPMDSNFDNLCLPQNDTSSEYYYCFFILKNNYNEANLNFSVSSSKRNFKLIPTSLGVIFLNTSIFLFSNIIKTVLI